MIGKSRVLTFILVLLLTLSALSAVVAADGSDGIISVTASDIVDGKFTATVSISSNPGVSGMSLKLTFDRTKLTPVSFDAAKGICPDALSNMNDENPVDLAALDSVTYFFASHENIKKDGELFRVTFSVAEDASGTTDLSISYARGGVTNSGFATLTPSVSGCTVDISSAKHPEGVITLESEHLGLDYYRVTVGLYGNSGIAALRFRVDLTESIVIRSIDFDGIFDDVTSNATQPGVNISDLHTITYNYTSADNRTDVGTLFTFTFRLVDGFGRASVSYENGDIVNSAAESLSPYKYQLTFGKLDVATVTFDVNTTQPLSGDRPTDITNVKNSYITLPFCPERQDKAYFLGWSADKNATSAAYKAGDKLLLTSDLTLYAVWSVRTYAISYNANGGTGAPASQTKVHGTPITLSEEIPTRANYDFIGWSVLKNGTAADYNAGDIYSENLSVTLYAVWQPHSYVVSFDANGGENAPLSVSKLYGVEMTLPTAIPTKSGAGFAGWSDSKTGSVKYLPGAAYTANGNATLYAVWTSDKYDVTFDANGGTGAPAVLSLAKSLNLTLPLTVPEKTGYTFLGWAESKTATKPDYLIGGQYAKKTSVTLYAVWEVSKYTVTFDLNGGTGSISPITFSFGSFATIPSATPTRNGYTFAGWSENAASVAAEFAAGDKYTHNRSTTLYAVWNPNKYKITFNANGGTGAPAAQDKLYDTDLRLSAVKPVKEGFKFLGWAESADARSPEYAAGTFYKENRALTLYAVWTPITYTVKYDANNTTGDYRIDTKVHGSPLYISSYYPSRLGYVFLGWAYTPDALTPEYRYGDRYTQECDATLYAVWTVKEYTVLYDANGGSEAPGMQKKIHDIPLTIINVKPKRSGYIFIGWALSADGSVAYLPADTYSDNADVTLYAVWSESSNAAQLELSTTAGGSKKVKVDVLLSVNSGIASLTFDLNYDNTKVRPVSIAVNEDEEPIGALSGASLNVDPNNVPQNADRIVFSWRSTSNKKSTGVILSVTFEVLCDVGEKTDFSVSVRKSTTNAAGKVVPTAVDTKVYTVPNFLPGDLNDDGTINAKDSVLLAQFLASWSVEMNESAADCNGDGTINAKDSVLLAQYLANWDVTLG